jgi:hypothetical protein
LTQLPLTLPPAAAKADPPSSHAAAAELTSSGARQRQVELVAALVRKWPGLTSRELAERSGVDYHLVARRLPDCKRLGLAALIGGDDHPELRVCRHGGRLCVQWVPK